jgi:diaminohydroxyphosphoribosylaminopyrimidine deaminase/5-amino-6-(5-phosphoribosylamino)uracil reductase
MEDRLDATDERFMERALELAARPPHTSPNPRVGAVVVKGGRIISEAAHMGAGSPHAEAVALDFAGTDAAGAVLYVTLEPCVHQGLTPACVPAVIEAGLQRVVIAMPDPDDRVAGAGIEQLRNAGIEVEEGLLAEAALRINLPYVYQRQTGRPLLTLKLALTLDGRLSAPDGSSRWITSEEAREQVHRRRQEADAVMIGAGTVLADDPQLTVRDVPATRQPTRVVVDGRGRVPATAAVFGPGADVIIATTEAAPHDAQIAWKEAGADVVVLPEADDGLDLEALVEELGQRGFIEVICEGGGELATTLLRADLVERLELHQGPVLVGRGGAEIGVLGIGTMRDAHLFDLDDFSTFGSDLITTYLRRR